MAKTTWTLVRATAMLAGASLAVSGGLAGAGPAVAASRAPADPGPSAAAFARFLPHGHGLRPGAARLRRSGISPAALPAGGRRVPKPGQSQRALRGLLHVVSQLLGRRHLHAPSAGNGGRNEVLHWTGGKWSQIRITNPGGIGTNHFSQLNAVRCTTARNCWAVGFYEQHGVPARRALHWNGKSWSRVATPTPGGTLNGDFNELFDVVCTSPGSCWADGEYGTVPGPPQR